MKTPQKHEWRDIPDCERDAMLHAEKTLHIADTYVGSISKKYGGNGAWLVSHPLSGVEICCNSMFEAQDCLVHQHELFQVRVLNGTDAPRSS